MEAENDVFKAIYARRSIRRFNSVHAVEREKIVSLLKAAMAAPSACNIQPWEFVVVTDAATVEKLRVATGENGRYDAPAIIAVCGDDAHIPWKDHGVFDCAAAAQNMMLVAPTLGLGTVVIGGFDRVEVKSLLSIPEGVEPICLLYVGYPGEEKCPRTRFTDAAVHWERFDGERPRGPRPGNILAFGGEASL
jgi:nitroreductase